MFHGGILQPIVVNGQQPIVVFRQRKIFVMNSNEKRDFAERMNKVADMLGIPPKGSNRQELLGRVFGVSQESARKWLSGESIPQVAKCIEIAKRAGVSFDWLMTGRGVAAYEQTPEAQVYQAMQKMDEVTKYQVVKITNTLAEP
ncbi:hypothetical protein MTYP_01022 [Methylophilaceae bacterium]|nr:hypothetical protein MTYP_01022 [Methylophilaceae bacterium]